MFTTTRASLQDAVRIFRRHLPTPNRDLVLVKETSLGTCLAIYSFDPDPLSVSYHLLGPASGEEYVLPFRALERLASKVSAESLTVKLAEGFATFTTPAGASFSIPATSPDDFPAMPTAPLESSSHYLRFSPKDLATAYRAVSFALNPQEDRQGLRYVRLTYNKLSSTARLTATDGRRAAFASFLVEGSWPETPTLISPEILWELAAQQGPEPVSIMHNDVRGSQGAYIISAEAGPLNMHVQLVRRDYPNVDAEIPKNPSLWTMRIEADSLTAAVGEMRAALDAEEVILELSSEAPPLLLVESEKGHGKLPLPATASTAVPFAEDDPRPYRIHFDARFLMEASKQHAGADLRVNFRDPVKDPAVFFGHPDRFSILMSKRP